MIVDFDLAGASLMFVCRFIGPSTVFGSSSKLANVEQWRCVTILRNHTGGKNTHDFLSQLQLSCIVFLTSAFTVRLLQS